MDPLEYKIKTKLRRRRYTHHTDEVPERSLSARADVPLLDLGPAEA